MTKLTGDDLVKGITKGLFRIGVKSEDRTRELLRLSEYVDSETFWKVFHSAWGSCDDTWHLNEVLIDTLSFQAAEFEVYWSMNKQQRTFFDALPSHVNVYRGCSRNRIRGISWTTSAKVARNFAQSHRGMHVPDPVVVCATIPKCSIFTVLVDREESEIVLDPIELIDPQVLEEGQDGWQNPTIESSAEGPQCHSSDATEGSRR